MRLAAKTREKLEDRELKKKRRRNFLHASIFVGFFSGRLTVSLGSDGQ